MPYKSPKDQREAQRRYRERNRQKIERLRRQFPDVHRLIWGEQRRRQKR